MEHKSRMAMNMPSTSRTMRKLRLIFCISRSESVNTTYSRSPNWER